MWHPRNRAWPANPCRPTVEHDPVEGSQVRYHRNLLNVEVLLTLPKLLAGHFGRRRQQPFAGQGDPHVGVEVGSLPGIQNSMQAALASAVTWTSTPADSCSHQEE